MAAAKRPARKAPAKKAPARRATTAKKAAPAKKAAAKKAPAQRAAKSEPCPTCGKPGPIERATVSHLEALRRSSAVDTLDEVLAATALNLARHLDRAEPVTMTSSWAAQLRATLHDLAPGRQVPPPDPDDDGGAAEDGEAKPDPDAWLDGLPAAVRDTSQP